MPAATSRCWSRPRCATRSCSCAASTPTPSSSSATTRRWARASSAASARRSLDAVRAVLLGAGRVERERVVLQLEAARHGNVFLALFDLGVVELLDPAAVHADQMVVVLAFVELEHRLAALEVVARQDAGLLELHQHAIHRRQSDVG